MSVQRHGDRPLERLTEDELTLLDSVLGALAPLLPDASAAVADELLDLIVREGGERWASYPARSRPTA